MTSKDFLQGFHDLLLDNFELIMYIHAALLLLFIFSLVVIFVSVRHWFENFQDPFNTFMYRFLIIVEVIFIIVVGRMYWVNYHELDPPLNYPQDVLFDTQWAKGDSTLYFLSPDSKQLKIIQVNGENEHVVFSSDEVLREYQFSPDGHYILVASAKQLHLIDRETHAVEMLDALQSDIEGSAQMKGSISHIRWSPDSQKIYYEMSQWSKIAVRDDIYVYNVSTKEKRKIKNQLRKISSLYWGKSSENLYHVKHESLDTSERGYPFQVHITRIPLDTLEPEFVRTVAHESSTLPFEILREDNIHLFLKGKDLTFKSYDRRDIRQSNQGPFIGVDEQDFLYFVWRDWFRERLFKIPREPDLRHPTKYQYKGGNFTIQLMRWLPSGEYIILEDTNLGILILDPKSRMVGRLLDIVGHTVGWYHPLP